MNRIPLTALPKQTIGFNVDGAYWTVTIYLAAVHMCADITINGVAVVSGVRCFAGTPLLPYPYMYEPDYGNFIFDVDADWTLFGTSCNLYYLTNSEYAEFDALMTAGTM